MLSRETYGRPRMYAELRDDGWLVNHKRVGRLMSQEGLQGASRRKKWRTTKRAKDARPAPDLVERNFGVDGPDQLWVADITYVPTSSGFLYLAVVVDAWSRRVVQALVRRRMSKSQRPRHAAQVQGVRNSTVRGVFATDLAVLRRD